MPKRLTNSQKSDRLRLHAGYVHRQPVGTSIALGANRGPSTTTGNTTRRMQRELALLQAKGSLARARASARAGSPVLTAIKIAEAATDAALSELNQSRR